MWAPTLTKIRRYPTLTHGRETINTISVHDFNYCSLLHTTWELTSALELALTSPVQYCLLRYFLEFSWGVTIFETSSPAPSSFLKPWVSDQYWADSWGAFLYGLGSSSRSIGGECPMFSRQREKWADRDIVALVELDMQKLRVRFVLVPETNPPGNPLSGLAIVSYLQGAPETPL
jgi:hypothetical protein